MYLVYKPEGSDEPKTWKFDPNKLMSVERELLERRTDMAFLKFVTAVMEGHSGCRRALLFMYLKRDNARIRYEDVDFAWDELELSFSKQEYTEMREKIAESLSGEELRQALEAIDAELETALDETELDGGKAPVPTDA